MKMDYKKQGLLIIISLTFFVSGCTSLLPSAKQTIKSPWDSFDEAKKAFDKIIPYETTAEELEELGFDPFLTPNIKILTYLDVTQKFMFNPSIKKEDLDLGLQDCLDAKTNCKAYEILPKFTSNKRFGNVLLDLFNFKRRTHQTGWEFSALVVLIDGEVVYKLWGGKPAVDELNETKNPLGPLQNPPDIIKTIPIGF